MSVAEAKKWVAIISLVGVIMSVGGAFAVTKVGVAQNAKDIEQESISRQEVDNTIMNILDATCDDMHNLERDQSSVNTQILLQLSVLQNDVLWIRRYIEQSEN